MPTNNQIVKNAAITTDTVTHGLLNPEQARRFIRQAFEQTALGGLIRHEMRTSRTGQLDKIGIANRILRKKVENIDANADGSPPTLDPNTGQITGYRAKPTFDTVPYSTVPVRLPWEVTEETLRENIEGQGLEATITALMTRQWGNDMEDLCLNGDEAVPLTDPDGLFLYINDGWVKQISNGGHVYDASAYTEMTLDMFYNAIALLPNKYNNGRLRWVMSPFRAQQWELFLLNRAINNGSSAPDSLYNSPGAIPTVRAPFLPDDKILLTDPQNLIVVTTYNMKIRKTDSDVRSIMEDKRFYVIHADFDAIIEELDAAAIIENLNVASNAGNGNGNGSGG